MNKMITTIIGITAFMVVAFMPSQAEALKIKVEPSVIFRQSFDRTFVRPVYVPPPTPVYELRSFVDPVTGELHQMYVPCAPRVLVGDRFYSRTFGTDYQLGFRFR